MAIYQASTWYITMTFYWNYYIHRPPKLCYVGISHSRSWSKQPLLLDDKWASRHGCTILHTMFFLTTNLYTIDDVLLWGMLHNPFWLILHISITFPFDETSTICFHHILRRFITNACCITVLKNPSPHFPILLPSISSSFHQCPIRSYPLF